MSLTADEVRWVAKLARLELTDVELEVMTRQLSGIVDFVAQLRAVDTEGVEPLAHPLDLSNVFRPDNAAPSLRAEEALANAPARTGDFYRVPAVLD